MLSLKLGEQAPLHIPFLASNGSETTTGYRSPSFSLPGCVTIVADPAFPGSDSRKIVRSVAVGNGQIIAHADAGSGSTTDFRHSDPLDVVVTAGDFVGFGPLEAGMPVPIPG